MGLLILFGAFVAICFACTTKEARAAARARQRTASRVVGAFTALVLIAWIVPELLKR